MFTHFFFLLKAYGVPVTITEWLTLAAALDRGLAFSSLTEFYRLARGIVVKSEAFFDQYDQAFSHAFRGIETPQELKEAIWEWLANPLPPLHLSPEERALLEAAFAALDLEELNRLFEERLNEQAEAHHGGQHWIGTGGTSPFGHSGFHPGGIRVGGESLNGSAVKVAGERRYREYRTDATLDVRQFELAFRRLRVLSNRTDLPPDELDLDETIAQTARKAGMLSLEWRRSRRNQVRVLVLMDAGGSMHQHIQVCNRLFTAVHRATHFKDLRFYYFHNCVYDRLYLDPMCHPRNSAFTAELLHQLAGEYKLILVGDATMAPTELLSRDGIIWWGHTNEEPGIEWLQRLHRHFTHSAWLNPIPQGHWSTIYGAETISLVGKVFPMFELTVEGLTAAVKTLSVRR
jgi:uncharacterized protein with von Willebrand factor type A (vWA) domain